MAKHQEGLALRGLVYGVAFSLPIWAVIAFAIWFFCLR